MEWFIILHLELVTPHEMTAMVSSEIGYTTKAICDVQKDLIKPNLDVLIKSLFGKTATYTDASVECKEVKKGQGI